MTNKTENRLIGIQEKADSCQMGGELGDCVKKGEGIKKY